MFITWCFSILSKSWIILLIKRVDKFYGSFFQYFKFRWLFRNIERSSSPFSDVSISDNITATSRGTGSAFSDVWISGDVAATSRGTDSLFSDVSILDDVAATSEKGEPVPLFLTFWFQVTLPQYQGELVPLFSMPLSNNLETMNEQIWKMHKNK